MAEEIIGIVAVNVVAEPGTLEPSITADLKGKSFAVALAGEFKPRQVQTALTAAVKESGGLAARVNAEFRPAQVRAAFLKAVKEASPLIAHATIDVDQKGVAQAKKGFQKVQSDLTTTERNEIARRKTLRDRDVVEQGRAAERVERQSQVINARKSAADLAFNRRVAINAQNTHKALLRISSKPIALRITDNIGQVSQSLRGFEATTSRVLRTSLLSFAAFSAGVTLALGAVSAAAIKSFAQVEIAAVRAGAVFTSDQFSKQLEATGKGFDDFGKRVKASSKVVIEASNEIALQTIFNPAEIAAGAQAFAQAGLSQQETLKKNADGFSNLAVAARFAQNEQLDIADATEKLVGGLKAAGLETSQLTSLTDKFTLAANATNATAAEIADAFANQAAGAFKAYGQSVDSTIATISLFAKANLRGKEAGTQTAIVIREITNALTNKAPKAFEKYGIAIEDAQGKALPFEQTLVQFGKALSVVQKNQGAKGVARFRKELGLTERSLRGLIILAPQIAKLGPEGAAALSRASANSAGATARQSEALFDTISVQFGNFVESIGIQFQKIGEQAAPGFKRLIDQFNGPGGLFQQVESQSIKFGERLGRVFDDIAAFVQTSDFRKGISILAESIKITISGVAEVFKQLGVAFGGVEDGESAFVGFTKTIRAFAEVSARVLPQVARIIGEVTNFLIENADAFEVFAKATLGIYALNKAFTLFVAPVAAATKGLFAFRGALVAAGTAQVAGTASTALGSIAASLGLVNKEAVAAQKSVEALQATSIAASTAGAVGAAGAGQLALFGEGAGAAQLTRFEKITAAVTRARSAITGLGADLASTFGKFSIITAAVVAFAFQVKGFTQEIRNEFNENQQLKNSLEQLQPAFSALKTAIGAVGSALAAATGFVTGFFENFGRLQARALASVINFAGGLVQAFNTFRQEGIVQGFKVLGEALANALTAPLRFAFSFILNNLADLIDVFSRLPKVGNQFDDAANAIDRASKRINDLEFNLADAQKQAQLTAGAVADIGNITTSIQVKAFEKDTLSAAEKRNRFIIARLQRENGLDKKSQPIFTTPSFGGGGGSGGGGSGGGAGGGPARQRDLTAEAAARVEALRFSERNKKTQALIDRIDKAGAKGYKATRFEAALLEKALPGIDKALETQRDKVSKLSDALAELRNTQIAGSKAFSDAAFANEQAVKQLQLARLDALAVPGTTDTSQNIKDIDKQIQDLQASAERASLVESLQLDPLKRKLEDTFNPVKELPFGDIVKQFQQLSAEQSTQQAKLSSTERIQKLLSETNSAAADNFRKVDAAASAAASSVSSVGAAASSATSSVQKLGQANSDLSNEGGNLSGTLAAGITQGADQVASAISEIIVNARTLFGNAALPGTPLQLNASTAGFATALSFAKGFRTGYLNRILPGVRSALNGVNTLFVSSIAPDSALQVNVRTAGFAIMDGFLKGMTDKFGADTKAKGTVAYFLNVFIPEWIKANKGPVAYDATILVPAGQAVMDGFGSGLRSGFSQIQQFVKDVGPSLSEFISTDAFSGRTATIMADIAVGKKPDIEGVFGDLRQDSFNLPGVFGPVDPSLSFLHKTLSLADTAQMAAQLGKLFGLTVTSLNTGHHAAGSDHYRGIAADFSNSSGGGDDPRANTPQMLALANALKPLQGSIIKQLIYQNHDFLTGGFIGNHQNHDHVAFLEGAGFSEFSGKIGKALASQPSDAVQGPVRIFDIPGASSVVDAAISTAALRWKLPVALLAAVAKQESGFRPNVVSGDGGYGLFQLTSQSLVDAADRMGGRLNPQANSLVGAKYLHDLIKQLGSIPLGLSAYNSGPGGGEGHGHVDVPGYVSSVLRYFEDFKKIFGGFRASGGSVQRGVPYVVGERGPELFTPSTTGRITNARQTSQIASSGGPQMIDNSTTNIVTAASDPAIILRHIQLADRRKMQRVNRP